MNRVKLISRVRSLTRDFNGVTFREQDIIDYLNEGVDRLKHLVPQLANEVYLENVLDVPVLLPLSYHYLLALYSASRCYFQNEQINQAQSLMNEFEVKVDELIASIDSGRVTILDSHGHKVEDSVQFGYVRDNYFSSTGTYDDEDDGVEGVE